MTKSVMIVDDAESYRNLSSNISEKLGYSVTSVHSGEECIKLLKEGKFPDLVILDIVMEPEMMNGYDTLRRMREFPEMKNVPVVIFSSKSETNDIIWAKAQGAQAYVTKPLSTKESRVDFAKVIRRLLGA